VLTVNYGSDSNSFERDRWVPGNFILSPSASRLVETDSNFPYSIAISYKSTLGFWIPSASGLGGATMSSARIAQRDQNTVLNMHRVRVSIRLRPVFKKHSMRSYRRPAAPGALAFLRRLDKKVLPQVCDNPHVGDPDLP